MGARFRVGFLGREAGDDEALVGTIVARQRR